jgi:hypothetical protein
VLFDAIFISLFVLGWLICGFLPWLALSVGTRGDAGLGYLPLCLFTAVVAGIAVPVLGLNDGRGLWVSFVVAFAAPSLLLAAARYSRATRRGVAAERRSAASSMKDRTAK